ncbi:hypothetical protein C8R44DRAFT_886416 [Mycena epipterygia]|nr:hypothetical protein C8R44DRAFT_886416 [Mycena epipterygia]
MAYRAPTSSRLGRFNLPPILAHRSLTHPPLARVSCPQLPIFLLPAVASPRPPRFCATTTPQPRCLGGAIGLLVYAQYLVSCALLPVVSGACGRIREKIPSRFPNYGSHPCQRDDESASGAGVHWHPRRSTSFMLEHDTRLIFLAL